MPQVAAPVDPARAMRVLEAALTAWKEGKPITAVTEGAQSVVVQDFDWMGKKKLTAYEIVGNGLVQDANLRVEVLLSLADYPDTKRVAYIVGTSPRPTVFRAFE